jgi:intracellular sulfur oxidation DsrE/DsrF family protein
MQIIARRAFVTLATIATLALGAVPAAQAQNAPHKVIFQVSDGDPQKWNLTLNNAKNVQDNLGVDKVDLEIVAYGPGIGMLKMESPVANRISAAVKAGVKIVACEVTMKAQNLSRADMLSEIGYVPGGVVELMTRQEQGWSYIRP